MGPAGNPLVDYFRDDFDDCAERPGSCITATSLTVFILTLNEQDNIKACIDSVRSADEILVVDGGSTDLTTKIAAQNGARVVAQAMTDFSSQRNFAPKLASSDWILHLDADERVTEALWAEVNEAISSGTADAFMIPTLNVVLGAPLRHGGWYPQYHVRLQHRGFAMWAGTVHERAVVSGRVGKLRVPIVHHGHPDLHTFLAKVDRYTSIEAKGNRRSSAELALLAMAIPVPYFLYKYVVQLGFLDGWRGLAAAILLSFYKCAVYLKAIELAKQKNEPEGA